MTNKPKNNYEINSIELIFVSSSINKKIVDEVKEQINIIASKYDTEIIYKFEESNKDKIEMKMYNHLTPNQYLTKDFFKFYEEFLKYTNKVEEKYSNFITLPID